MTIPDGLARITMQFAYEGGTEQAEFSVWGKWGTDPGLDTTALEASLSDLALAAASHWISDVRQDYAASQVAFSGCIATSLNATGHTVAEKRYVAAPGAWNGSAADSLPWSSSVVVGLYTYTPGSFIAHARRRRGRYYLPVPGRNILATGPTGELDTTKMTNLCNDNRNWLRAIADAGIAGGAVSWTPGVLSRTAGSFAHLTDVVVDEKLDTQRRRAKKEPAGRVVVTF